jgi:hypothetical protein
MILAGNEIARRRVSEDLGGKFEQNLLGSWLTNDYYPMRMYPQDLIGEVDSVTHFVHSTAGSSTVDTGPAGNATGGAARFTGLPAPPGHARYTAVARIAASQRSGPFRTV